MITFESLLANVYGTVFNYQPLPFRSAPGGLLSGQPSLTTNVTTSTTAKIAVPGGGGGVVDRNPGSIGPTGLAILRGLIDSHVRRDLKEKEADQGTRNPDSHYVLEVAETLSRFSPHQKAMAKAKIHQVLLEIEFPPEQCPPP